MWAVGITRPYYPSVNFYDNEAEAYQEYINLCIESPDEGGQFETRIFISEVKEFVDIQTHY